MAIDSTTTCKIRILTRTATAIGSPPTIAPCFIQYVESWARDPAIRGDGAPLNTGAIRKLVMEKS